MSADTPKGLWATLFEAGLVVGYIGLVVFVAGWSYVERWFACFGINISSLDKVNDRVFEIYALWVLHDFWPWLLLVGPALIVAVVQVPKQIKQVSGTQDARPAEVLVAVTIALAGLFGAGWLGQARADRQVATILGDPGDTFRRVIVHAKPGSAAEAFLKDKHGEDGCLRKLYQDGRTLYLYPGYRSLSTQGVPPPVYAVPLGEIAVLEIINHRALCEP